MAELTPQERLQPSLLDRLVDDEPNTQVEPRERRVLSMTRLRECVLRDLTWLLNTGCLAQMQDLENYPQVETSVLNYGVQDLSGITLSGVQVPELERRIRKAIIDFEPRILPHSVKVSAFVAAGVMSSNSLSFIIEGELWAQPLPLRLFLKTEVDLETGTFKVV